MTNGVNGPAQAAVPGVAGNGLRRPFPRPRTMKVPLPPCAARLSEGNGKPHMPVIEAVGLTKTYRVFQKNAGLLGAVRSLVRREYKEVRAVDGVSFTIEPGEMVAFLGPNGAGKTTTLKMLSGLIYPTSGTARVLDVVPWERADAFR